jgi:succinyl-diaminopimelate desuccinylase
MEPEKCLLLDRIDRDRELMIGFLQDFIRCPSPNPPGDTRIAARHVQELLDGHGVAYRVIAPNPIMPNIVANFAAHKPGRHHSISLYVPLFARDA